MPYLGLENIWKSNKWTFITRVNLNFQNYENQTINYGTSDPSKPQNPIIYTLV